MMATHGLKVLLAEDEANIREVMAEILSQNGYRPVTAPDGREALHLFSTEKPDIVVTDVNMPVMDGFELLTNIKQISPETCVVVITGYGSEDAAIRALRNGASNYFLKPIRLSEFVYAINVLADLIQSRRQRQFDFTKVSSEERTIILGNNLDDIYSVVHELTRAVADSPVDTEALQISLLELITNAIEHGNLEISREQKREALRGGTLGELYGSRTDDNVLGGRVVKIRYRYSPDRIVCSIRDGGHGFNWRDLIDPTETSNLYEANGRGIFITRLYVDDLKFNDAGNEVTITKHLRQPGKASQEKNTPAPT